MSLYLALKQCTMICSDLGTPPEEAAELHRHYGLGHLVSYHSVDATAIPFPDECFDVVVLKSVLAALGNGGGILRNQRTAVSEIRRVLKKGGFLLFAENMRASPIHGLLRRQCVPWGRFVHYFTMGELDELLADFTRVDLSFYGFAATFGRREWQRSLLHALDVVTLPLVPRSSRYVVFGIAQK